MWSVAVSVRAQANTTAAAATLTSVAPNLQPVGQGRALDGHVDSVWEGDGLELLIAELPHACRRTLVGLQQKKVVACTASDRLPSTIARTLARHVTDAVDQRGLAFSRTATKEDLLIRDDSAIIPSSTWAVVERSSPESASIFAVDFL